MQAVMVQEKVLLLLMVLPQVSLAVHQKLMLPLLLLLVLTWYRTLTCHNFNSSLTTWDKCSRTWWVYMAVATLTLVGHVCSIPNLSDQTWYNICRHRTFVFYMYKEPKQRELQLYVIM